MSVIQLQNIIIKNSPDTVRARWPHAYRELLAASLCLYAERDSYFGNKLSILTRNLPRQHLQNKTARIPESAAIFMPTSAEAAERRALWLIQQDAEIFHSFIIDRPALNPKLIVVGLMVVAIPGITMGKLRRRKESMTFIIREDAAAESKLDMARSITEASHDVLAQAIRAANCDMQKMEPEMADWFFGEKTMSFYEARGQEMARIQKELEQSDSPFAVSGKNGDTHVLAISPAANRVYMQTCWKIHPVD